MQRKAGITGSTVTACSTPFTSKTAKATYRNRWIRTKGFNAEATAGDALWEGIAESRANNPDDGERRRLKDTANTDVMFHNGNLVALWYLAGEPYSIDPLTLETLGTQDWNGTRTSCVMAHAKVDPRTGEFVFFDYSPTAPYMSYGVVSADGVVKHLTDIDIPGPRDAPRPCDHRELLDPYGPPAGDGS